MTSNEHQKQFGQSCGVGHEHRLTNTNLARRVICLAITLLPLTGAAIAAPLPAADDSWPRYAHDRALTGRTTLSGDIARPRHAWSLSVAGTTLDIELRPAEGRHRLRLPGDEAPAPRTIKLAGPAWRDVDGSGTPRPAAETYHQRWAKILPGVKGLQRTGWDQTFTTARICHLQLFAYDRGYDKPRRVWQSEPEDTVFSPLCVVQDIDGDGVQEICVALHYRVMIYEGTTGRKESELKFHSSRSYGWFGLADVDADGQQELVVLSDFQSHLDVLNYDPSRPEPERLSVRWRRDVEQAIERRAKWPQIGPQPVVDVTGDGKPEIVINLLNDTGDGQWHTVILSAADGRQMADLPRRYTQGNADVDGDGAADVFCAATDGVLVPTRGRIEIVRFSRDAPAVIWSDDDAGFGVADLPRLGPTWSTVASRGMRHVLLTDEPIRPAFLVLAGSRQRRPGVDSGLSDDAGTSVLAMRHDGTSGINRLWQVDGLVGNIETRALTSEAGGVSVLLRLQLPMRVETTLTGAGATVQVVARGPLGTGPFAPIVARTRPAGPPVIYTEGAAEQLLAVRPPAGGRDQAEVIWRRPGRGMGDRAAQGSPVAVDLDADGVPEVVAATATHCGAAALVAWRADGRRYWRHVFEQTPGLRPVHNYGALTHWWPGQFRSARWPDLMVNTRRGLMHSDVGHLLDGRTGRQVWSHDKAVVPGQFRWAYAGKPLAVADVIDDGREELINLYPVCFWIADGATGAILRGRDLASRKLLPAWAAYGEPMVHDFLGSGSKQILLDSVYILALLDTTGKPIWHGKRRRDYPTGRVDDNFGETTGVRHALVDFDGDGRLEIASGGYRDGVRAIDAASGKVLWRLAAPSPTVPKSAAANIDGVGGEELIYAAGNTLVAITGDRKAGRILWTWRGPALLSMPAIADVDDDQRAEIIVQSADGTLHCIDGPG